MRRTIARYLVVALIQTLRCIDVKVWNVQNYLFIVILILKVKKRFPSLSHLSDAGILTDHERKIIEDVDAKCIQVCHLIMSAALL